MNPLTPIPIICELYFREHESILHVIWFGVSNDSVSSIPVIRLLRSRSSAASGTLAVVLLTDTHDPSRGTFPVSMMKTQSDRV